MNKVRNGTPQHSVSSLCDSCSNCQHIRGRKLGEDLSLCHTRGANPMSIRYAITECNDYDNKACTALWQLEKIAWRFSVDDRRKTAGFLTPAQWREKHPPGPDMDD